MISRGPWSQGQRSTYKGHGIDARSTNGSLTPTNKKGMNVHTDKQQGKMARNKTDHIDLAGCTLCARTTQPGFNLKHPLYRVATAGLG